MELLIRGLETTVLDAWSKSSVVVIEGPRASGKTSLAEMIVGRAKLFRLDDEATLRRAEASPRAWLESLPHGSAVDEAQLLPRIAIEAKRVADDSHGAPGRLLLTGSHRIPRDELGGTDPLAGRATRLDLWPLSQAERDGTPRDVITALFDSDPSSWLCPPLRQEELFSRIRRGGFPGDTPVGNDYIDAVIGSARSSRDTDRIARLYRWLCGNSGREQNKSAFGQANDLDGKTVDAYLAELRRLFLVFDVESFDADAAKQTLKRPRTFIVDTALLSAFEDGPACETFVACELKRLIASSSTRAKLFRWRKDENHEVDFIIERERDRKVIAIEVKSARESSVHDFKPMRTFAKQHARFHAGFVLHCGDNTNRHDSNMWSAPISALWSIGATQQSSLPRSVAPKPHPAFEALRLQRSNDEPRFQRILATTLATIRASLPSHLELHDIGISDATYTGQINNDGKYAFTLQLMRRAHAGAGHWEANLDSPDIAWMREQADPEEDDAGGWMGATAAVEGDEQQSLDEFFVWLADWLLEIGV